MGGFPFRIIVVRDDGHSSQVVRLQRAPDIGDRLELPHGLTVHVRRVLSATENTVSGVVLTEPE